MKFSDEDIDRPGGGCEVKRRKHRRYTMNALGRPRYDRITDSESPFRDLGHCIIGDTVSIQEGAVARQYIRVPGGWLRRRFLRSWKYKR